MLHIAMSAATNPIAGISHRIGATIAAGEIKPSTSAATAQPLITRYSTISGSTRVDKWTACDMAALTRYFTDMLGSFENCCRRVPYFKIKSPCGSNTYAFGSLGGGLSIKEQ